MLHNYGLIYKVTTALWKSSTFFLFQQINYTQNKTSG